MNSFIQNLLLINAGISVVITAFILLRYFLKNKVHTKILCILWMIIFLRMFIPITIESNLGVVNNSFVLDSYTAVKSYVNAYTNSATGNTDTNDGVAINTAENALQSGNTPLPNGPIKKVDIALTIYAFGAAIVFSFILISNISFSKMLKQNHIEIDLSTSDKQVFAEQKIKQLKVYMVEDLHSPCLMGIIRPRILLNKKSTENEKIRRYSLYHETTHYKHKDNLVFLFGILACIINWFNPFMWLALHLSQKDREVHCDESVIKLIGEKEIIEYGKSLLFVAQNANSKLLTVSTTMTGGKKEMKQRIMNLVNGRKRWIIISILLTAIVIALIFVIGTRKSPEIQSGKYGEIQTIINMDEYPEYTAYFDEARNPSNTLILTIFRTDIDNDGTDELYTHSYARDQYPNNFIECYDLKTDTYSKLMPSDSWKYHPIQFGDKLYTLAINEANVASDEGYRAYELYLTDGQLSYKDIDSEIEQKIIEFMSHSSLLAIGGDEEHRVGFSSIDITDISIYDISTEETLINSYTQKDSDIMDKIFLLLSSGGSLGYDDIDHTSKAVITIDEKGVEKSITILFGESEYMTTDIEGDKFNEKNEGLRNYLNYLAAGSDAS